MTPEDVRALTAAIRDGLREGLQPLVDELRVARGDGIGAIAVEPPSGCSHPEEARFALGAMGDTESWECGVCRYRHHVEAAEVGA